MFVYCVNSKLLVSLGKLNWFQNYLLVRRQRVILPGVNSDWSKIFAGVSQGSILGPLLFLVFINDIVNEICSCIRLFADGTSLFIIIDDPVASAERLNVDLIKTLQWTETLLVTFNPNKTESLIISRKITKPLHPSLYMINQQVLEVDCHKLLGLYLSNNGSWHQQINFILERAWCRIQIMRKLKFKLDRKSLEIIYTAFIRPILEYGDVIWEIVLSMKKRKLKKVQLEAARIATVTTK